MHDEPSGGELHAEDAALVPEARGLSDAELLQGARTAHAEESATAGETTVARVRLGRWLAAIKDREAFLSEDCASIEDWAQKMLGIKRAMTCRYISVAPLEPALVRGHDLSVAKLACLARCPSPLRPGLIVLAKSASDNGVSAAAKAAREAFTIRRSVADALAAATRAMQRSAAGRSQQSRRQRAVPKAAPTKPLPGDAALRAANDTLQAVIDSGLAAGPGAQLDAWVTELQRTQRLTTQFKELVKNSTRVEFLGIGKENEELQGKNAPSERSDGAAEGAPPWAAPGALLVPDAATANLMKALRTDMEFGEELVFAEALFAILATTNQSVLPRCWRTLIAAVREAKDAERFPEWQLRDWLARVTSESEAVRWPAVWESCLCCSDLYTFPGELFCLATSSTVPLSHAVLVREAAKRHPPSEEADILEKETREDPWLEELEALVERFAKAHP